MSVASIRQQLERVRDRRASEEAVAAKARKQEADKRAAAAKARVAATATKSESTIKMRLREAERAEADANRAASDSAKSQARLAKYAKEESHLLAQLSSAEKSEAREADRRRKRDEDASRRRAADQRRRDEAAQRQLESRVSAAEVRIAELPGPVREKLRILVLASSGEGDIRVAREAKRIKDAVRSAYGRDLVELDVRPAATSNDLLDGLTQFRPHVVHFSGHSAQDLVVFEEDVDEPNEGHVVTDVALARALASVDRPPMLVVLNSCASAPQAERLVGEKIPFAIGMSDTVDDLDAITYAARFYAALTDGESVAAAHGIARAQLSLDGAADPDLPLLFEADGFDAANLVLVLRD